MIFITNLKPGYGHGNRVTIFLNSQFYTCKPHTNHKYFPVKPLRVFSVLKCCILADENDGDSNIFTTKWKPGL
jgi:hypothetical protein